MKKNNKKKNSNKWDEQDSKDFILYGKCFVPDRELQIKTICNLIPFSKDNFIVELCCGEGLLTQSILEKLPECNVLAMDISEEMIEKTRLTLKRFGNRVVVKQFRLGDHSWRKMEDSPKAFISSLGIHHLSDIEKIKLYTDILEMLAAGGALIVSDLIKPTTNFGRNIAGDQWDDAVRERSIQFSGDLTPYNKFLELNWNYYTDPNPDSIDQPASLFNQLTWLSNIGYLDIDVHWMKGGHVIFSANKK